MYLDGFSPATVVSNTVHHVTSGRGGDVTTIAQNVAGGWGHQASGIFVDGGYGPASVVSNTIYFITGGRGGDGGWDTGLTTGGAGADTMGIGLVSLFQADVRANTVTTVTAGTGGDGMDGPDGTGNGGDAGPGGYAYGILLDDFVTTTLPIQYNDVRRIRAGAGGDGGDGGDGDTVTGSDPNGGAGGQSSVGGYAYGILSQWYGVPLTFTRNTVEDIYGGAGGAGGDGGAAESGSVTASGGPGADGSAGGDAYGLYLMADWLYVPTSTVNYQFVSAAWAGAGGDGGLSGWSEDEGMAFPGGNGGAGGAAWGILAEQTVALIHNGYVLSIVGGNGGDGNAGNDVSSENMGTGGGAGPGGAGGPGGRGTGIEVQKDGSLVDPTSARSVWGGDGGYGGKGGEDDDFRAAAPTGDAQGGPGGPGGDGGDAHGCYNNGGARVTFYIVGASQVYGGWGGGGGAGGAAYGAPSGNPAGLAFGGFGGPGGLGGAAYGLRTSGLTPTVELLTTQMIGGGAGGAGGRGGDARDEIQIQQPGPTLGGGMGGAGGAAYGLYNESAGNGGRLYRNETFLVTGGLGGNGGRGGDGTETFSFGAGPVLGSWGGDGGPGGDGWGLQNLAISDTVVARTTAYTITGGSAGNGGDGGDNSYVSLPPGSFPPGDGGMGGLGGYGYGVDSDARMENNLAYRVYGGAGGSGGNGGLDLGGGPPASGGNGGDGGAGITFGATNGIPLFNNTAAKTQGGGGGAGGMGSVPVQSGAPGDSIGVWVVTGTLPGPARLFNDAVISHAMGITGGGVSLVNYSFISATIPFGGNVIAGGDNVIGVAPGFVDFWGDDYHLADCSAPAAEAGTVVPVAEDGDGELRPWGYFDVGYDEYWRSPLSAAPFQGVITDDTVWSGDYLLTGDVVITSGATLTVSPGATVYANAADGANLGIDLNRIEIIVRGALRSGTTGGITTTFTVTGCNPASGQWHGIRFESGGSGYLDPTVIEYGAHGVVISTTKPVTIADSVIRYNRHAPSSGNAWGAGLAIFAGDHLVTNTQIYSNSLLASGAGADAIGAGVWLAGGSTLFKDTLVYDNRAESVQNDGFGGGMALWGGGAPTLRNCEVHHNVVTATNRAFGGGVDIDDTNALIEGDSFIHDNVITATSGNAYGGGVSIGSFATTPAVIISTNRVMTNTCYAAGNCYGGGIGFYDNSRTASIIYDNLIAANSNLGDGGADGGGIGMAQGATADSLDGNIIRDNLAFASWGGGPAGGGIFIYDNVVTVTNNLLFNNRITGVPGMGGGIYAGSSGGAVFYLVNNTIVSNTSNNTGGGIHLTGGVLSNTIVVSNAATAVGGGGGVYVGGGGSVFGYNDVWNNSPNDYDSGTLRPASDINAAPLFVGAGDLATYYHLRQGSPCVDAGNGPGVGVPGSDYDSQSRPLGSGWDIGFDEVRPFTYTKQVDALTATIGSDLLYTIIVTNPDTIAPLANGWLTDALPINTTYAGGPVCNWAVYGYDSGSRTAWWNGSIPANNTLTCVYTVTVDRGLSDGTIISNTAFVTAGAQGGWTNHVKTEVYAPVFTITKRASGSPVAGAPLTYTLTVTNSGAGGSTNVVITDTVPANANYVSGGTLMPGGVVSWTVGLLAAGGGSAQASFVVTTCQTAITNTLYRIVTSTQGLGSPWGALLMTNLSAPTIVADFTYAPHTAPVNMAVDFADASGTNGGPIAAWGWGFGDANTGSGRSVSHAYAATGTYTVTLIVTDTCGYTATKTLTDAVTVVPQTPVFAVGKRAEGTPVAGAPFTYTIIVTNSGNLTGTNVVVTDAVPAGGCYVSGGTESGGVVSLTVGTVLTTAPSSVTWVVSACQTNLTNEWYRVAGSDQGVGSGWGPALATTLSSPTIAPDFSWTPLSPGATDVVTFTGSATTDGGPVAAWAWAFEGGGAAAGQVVTHTFGSDGAYTVTLTVTDTCGYSERVEKVVTVASCVAVDADFGWTTPALIGEPVTFTVALTAGTLPINYTWTWGDGTSNTATSLTATQHTYAVSGTVQVSLSAQNGCFNGVVAVHDVIVEPMRIYLPLVLRAYP